MKKNINMKFSHIILAVLLFTLTACEDFLVRKPKDELSPDTYFRTETECQLYTNNFYTILPAASDFYQEEDDYSKSFAESMWGSALPAWEEGRADAEKWRCGGKGAMAEQKLNFLTKNA